MEPVIHYVLLDHVLLEPDALVPICGAWDGGADWTTKRSVATCPHCRRVLDDEERQQRSERAGPPGERGGPHASL